MKKIIATRQMDEFGRVVLPAEARCALKMKNESALDIYIDVDAGEICLKAHENACSHCGSTQNLMKFQNQYICSDCQKEIANLSAK